MPELVPKTVGIQGLDWIMNNQFSGLLICLFFSVGFINAVNTVDGANGLVPSIFVIACYIFSPLVNFGTSPVIPEASFIKYCFKVLITHGYFKKINVR